MPTRLSIILPAKNEEQTIGVLVSRIRSTFPSAEVIVVDDGSHDATNNQAHAAGATIIEHPYSKGNGAAVKTGARRASGEILIFMDADGQHNPADIRWLVDKLDEGYDMVVGARKKGSQANTGRGLANAFYNRLASYMTGHAIADLTSGFRAVRADKFKEFLYLLPNGFSYPTTSTMAFFRAGHSVAYIPIVAAKREGKSHIRPIRDGARFLLIIFKIGSLYSPLKLFAPISLLFFVLGLGHYLHTFLTMQRFTNMSALLFITSILVFLIGLVSEQITALTYQRSARERE